MTKYFIVSGMRVNLFADHFVECEVGNPARMKYDNASHNRGAFLGGRPKAVVMFDPEVQDLLRAGEYEKARQVQHLFPF